MRFLGSNLLDHFVAHLLDFLSRFGQMIVAQIHVIQFFLALLLLRWTLLLLFLFRAAGRRRHPIHLRSLVGDLRPLFLGCHLGSAVWEPLLLDHLLKLIVIEHLDRVEDELAEMLGVELLFRILLLL